MRRNTLISTLAFILLGTAELSTAQNLTMSNFSVSTLQGVSFNGWIMDMKLDSDEKSMIVLSDGAIWRMDLSSKNIQLIAGSKSEGYKEGVGSSAVFNDPSGLLISQTKAVVSDTFNHCLREVDLITRQTSRLAGICRASGFKNGAADQARFLNPFGLLAYKSSILVADTTNNAVRLVMDGLVSTVVSGSHVKTPRYMTEGDGRVYVTIDSGILRLDPDSKSVLLIAGSASTTGFVDGSLLEARFYSPRGLISFSPGALLLADAGDHRLRLVDLVSKKVSTLCTGKIGNLDGYGDTCQLYLPWSVEIVGMTAFVGQDDGKIRTVTLPSPMSTPQTPVTSTLETATSIPQTPVNFTLETATSIPQTPVTSTLETATSIPQTPVNSTLETATSIPQTPVTSTLETATSIPQTPITSTLETATSIPQTPVTSTLKTATSTPQTSATSTSQTATSTLQTDSSMVAGRKVYLRVKYQVDCTQLDELAYVSLNTSLLHEYTNLARACQECNLPSSPDSPVVSCRSNLLTVSWKTDIQTKNTSMVNEMKAAVTRRLMKIQEANLNLNGRFLEILIITINPPIISPLKEINGTVVNVVVVPTCSLPVMVYNEKRDACE